MLRIEKILCPIDFSEFSDQAFEYALSLARRYNSKLFLQHVLEPVTFFSFDGLPGWTEMYEDFKTSAEVALADLVASHVAHDLRPETDVEVGAAAESILKFAEQKNADLIVMGIHGGHSADRDVIGSVTDKVVRKSSRPVLVVRNAARGAPPSAPKHAGLQIEKVLLASDFSDHARRAVTYALSLATMYRAELILAHVVESIPPDTDLKSETKRLVGQLQSAVPANWQGGHISTAVRTGKPYREIVQLAVEAQVDLIVLGGRGHSSVLDIAIFGSTTHRVLQLGPCSVLAVHL